MALLGQLIVFLWSELLKVGSGSGCVHIHWHMARVRCVRGCCLMLFVGVEWSRVTWTLIALLRSSESRAILFSCMIDLGTCCCLPLIHRGWYFVLRSVMRTRCHGRIEGAGQARAVQRRLSSTRAEEMRRRHIGNTGVRRVGGGGRSLRPHGEQ